MQTYLQETFIRIIIYEFNRVSQITFLPAFTSTSNQLVMCFVVGLGRGNLLSVLIDVSKTPVASSFLANTHKASLSGMPL
jgi:hypothetical protein